MVSWCTNTRLTLGYPSPFYGANPYEYPKMRNIKTMYLNGSKHMTEEARFYFRYIHKLYHIFHIFKKKSVHSFWQFIDKDYFAHLIKVTTLWQ